jgi:hypothetical protein
VNSKLAAFTPRKLTGSFLLFRILFPETCNGSGTFGLLAGGEAQPANTTSKKIAGQIFIEKWGASVRMAHRQVCVFGDGLRARADVKLFVNAAEHAGVCSSFRPQNKANAPLRLEGLNEVAELLILDS